jgi:hypothetical protein
MYESLTLTGGESFEFFRCLCKRLLLRKGERIGVLGVGVGTLSALPSDFLSPRETNIDISVTIESELIVSSVP